MSQSLQSLVHCLFTVICINMLVLHAEHLPAVFYFLRPLEGDLHFVSIAITLLLSQWELCREDKISFYVLQWIMSLYANISLTFQTKQEHWHSGPVFLLFASLLNLDGGQRTFQKVNNVLNVALTWLHFTRGAKSVLNHWKQHLTPPPLVLLSVQHTDATLALLASEGSHER